MPALTAMRFNPVLHAFAERPRARGVAGKAIVVAVTRKLLHLVYGVLKSGQPFDPNWAIASYHSRWYLSANRREGTGRQPAPFFPP